MTERPILFSAPMVRALLARRKTMTRRVLKPQPDPWITQCGFTCFTPPRSFSGRGIFQEKETAEKFFPLKYAIGDRLWVRETWRASSAHDDLAPSEIPPGDGIEYAADPERVLTGRNRAAIHMPRWASRITLEVTAVRIERLHAIEEDAAHAEGVKHRRAFALLWESINGVDAWRTNPWVAVLTFRRMP